MGIIIIKQILHNIDMFVLKQSLLLHLILKMSNGFKYSIIMHARQNNTF